MISGLIALMEHDGPQPGPINLGNPIELSVSELVDVVLDLTGSSSPVVQHPLPIDDPKRRRPDIARAAAVLGWTPTVALEDGLRATIRWFDEDRDRVRPERQAALSA
jgi:UDP-glucuronate decarboxylase